RNYWQGWAVPKTAREAIRVVERDGWYYVGTKGSHRHFRHPVKPGKVTIAGPLGKELPPSTLASIMKQAGLDRRRK
ncbi:MAG: type II toxin-antitoxin system HicA family toxin, partial [Acidimicrobiaceae bacterium]|nr:type II toxin-antitoxin system HicA family toxin [Acidimicrobiaceae bacterium]